ncbi:hypothetical protein ACWGNM_36345 [Streptomyces sp. NPDC055796]
MPVPVPASMPVRVQRSPSSGPTSGPTSGRAPAGAFPSAKRAAAEHPTGTVQRAVARRTPARPEDLPVRALAPARALTSSLPSAARPVRSLLPQAKPAVRLVPAVPPAVPVRPLAVQRLADPKPRTVPGAEGTAAHHPSVRRRPLPVAAPNAPEAQPAVAVMPVQRFSATPHLPPVPHTPPPPPPAPALRTVQRAAEPAPLRTTTTHPGQTTQTARTVQTAQPRGDAPTPDPAFNPRSLTEFQLDELTHRLISRITRQLRTEFRLDRERIGKLRDPRR